MNPVPEATAMASIERSGMAQLTNMRLALQTLNAAAEAGAGSPRICVFYGKSGYGKSVAAAYVAARMQAAFVEATWTMTQRSFLAEVAQEIGIIKPERTIDRLFIQVVNQMKIYPRPLIIDETDYLIDKKFANIIRDIHDKTQTPIMLIGEEALPAKLKSWDRFDNRIIAATAAQPASLEDALRLRDHYCPRITLADDLIAAMTRECRGVTRRIVVNLHEVQGVAMDAGRSQADLAWWETLRRPFITNDLPARWKAA